MCPDPGPTTRVQKPNAQADQCAVASAPRSLAVDDAESRKADWQTVRARCCVDDQREERRRGSRRSSSRPLDGVRSGSLPRSTTARSAAGGSRAARGAFTMSSKVKWSPASAQSASHGVIPRGGIGPPTDRLPIAHFAVARVALAVVDAPLCVPVSSRMRVVATALGLPCCPETQLNFTPCRSDSRQVPLRPCVSASAQLEEVG